MVSGINENLLSSTVEEIVLFNDVHYRAVNMRLWGLSYKEIANELRRKEQTVRSWFSQGGECHDYYQQLKKERCEEIKQHLDNLTDSLNETVIASMALIRKAVVEKKNENIALKVLLATEVIQGFELPNTPSRNDSELISFLKASITAYEKVSKLPVSNALDVDITT